MAVGTDIPSLIGSPYGNDLYKMVFAALTGGVDDPHGYKRAFDTTTGFQIAGATPYFNMYSPVSPVVWNFLTERVGDVDVQVARPRVKGLFGGMMLPPVSRGLDLLDPLKGYNHNAAPVSAFLEVVQDGSDNPRRFKLLVRVHRGDYSWAGTVFDSNTFGIVMGDDLLVESNYVYQKDPQGESDIGEVDLGAKQNGTYTINYRIGAMFKGLAEAIPLLGLFPDTWYSFQYTVDVPDIVTTPTVVFENTIYNEYVLSSTLFVNNNNISIAYTFDTTKIPSGSLTSTVKYWLANGTEVVENGSIYNPAFADAWKHTTAQTRDVTKPVIVTFK